MAELTRTTVDADGVSIALTAASNGGDKVDFANGQRLLVLNSDSSAHTVTIASAYTATVGSTKSDSVVTVDAGELAVIPLSNVFKDSNSEVTWTYDDETNLKVAVI